MITEVPGAMLQQWAKEAEGFPTLAMQVSHIACRAAHWGTAHGIGEALQDLQSHFWRVADNGVQLVRADDLVRWAASRSDTARCAIGPEQITELTRLLEGLTTETGPAA